MFFSRESTKKLAKPNAQGFWESIFKSQPLLQLQTSTRTSKSLNLPESCNFSTRVWHRRAANPRKQLDVLPMFAARTALPRMEEFHTNLAYSWRHRNLKLFLWQSIRGTWQRKQSLVLEEVLGNLVCVITWWHQDPSPPVWDLQTGISVTSTLSGAHQHWIIKLPKEGWKKAVMFSQAQVVPAVSEKLFWFHSIKSPRTYHCTPKRKIQIFVGL